MFENILIPLDGSLLAEAAIAPAAALCAKTGSKVTLMHLIEKNAPQSVHGQSHLTTEKEAMEYLEEISGNYFEPGIEVTIHVHSEEVSQVAASIVAHSQEFNINLIFLCAHGQSVIHDFVVGSIAQQVIAAGSTPVLLLQPENNAEYHDMKFNRFLVALDGEEDHECGLFLAADLAKATGAVLHLVRVVPTLATLSGKHAATGTLLPASTNAVLDIAEDEACEYLQEKLSTLQLRGIVSTAEVGRGDPAEQVVQSASGQNTDMIVMGTHGKKGLEAFWSASFAPRIIERTRDPLLLVPVAC